MATSSKTRLAAQRKKRQKPHYYLLFPETTMFSVAQKDECDTEENEEYICEFESRINWSTWGPSRVAK